MNGSILRIKGDFQTFPAFHAALVDPAFQTEIKTKYLQKDRIFLGKPRH